MTRTIKSAADLRKNELVDMLEIVRASISCGAISADHEYDRKILMHFGRVEDVRLMGYTVPGTSNIITHAHVTTHLGGYAIPAETVVEYIEAHEAWAV